MRYNAINALLPDYGEYSFHPDDAMKNILVVIMAVGACLFMQKSAMSEQVTHTLRCESEDFFPHRCQLPVAPRNSDIEEIRKIKQLSSKPCVEGKSWLASETGITVSNGCRAEFLVVYRTYDRSDRGQRWGHHSKSRDRQDWSDDKDSNYSSQDREDPTDIIFRSFEDILNKRPSREEIRHYRILIIDRGWTERQVRNDLRSRIRTGDR